MLSKSSVGFLVMISLFSASSALGATRFYNCSRNSETGFELSVVSEGLRFEANVDGASWQDTAFPFDQNDGRHPHADNEVSFYSNRAFPWNRIITSPIFVVPKTILESFYPRNFRMNVYQEGEPSIGAIYTCSFEQE